MVTVLAAFICFVAAYIPASGNNRPGLDRPIDTEAADEQQEEAHFDTVVPDDWCSLMQHVTALSSAQPARALALAPALIQKDLLTPSLRMYQGFLVELVDRLRAAYQWLGVCRGYEKERSIMFFDSAPSNEWALFIFYCMLLFVVDLHVFQRLPPTFLWHAALVIFWVILAAGFGVVVWLHMGREAVVDWAMGYLLEWMLSLDDLIVLHLITAAFTTPRDQIHKAVFVALPLGILMRMLCFMGVSELLYYMSWLRWPLGILLVWSGVEVARQSNTGEGMDVKDTRLIRALRWCLGSRLLDAYDETGALFVRDKAGRLQVTCLFVVVLCVEASDAFVAIDAVTAKTAQIPNQFIAASSTVLAMYGVRSMIFIFKDMIQMFSLLKYGVCPILIFVGIELMFSGQRNLPTRMGLIVTTLVFLVGIGGSIFASILRSRSTSAHSTSVLEHFRSWEYFRSQGNLGSGQPGPS